MQQSGGASQDAWLRYKNTKLKERKEKKKKGRKSHLDAISLSEGKHLPHSSQAHWPIGVKGRDDKRVTREPREAKRGASGISQQGDGGGDTETHSAAQEPRIKG